MANISIVIKGHLFNVVAALAGDPIDFSVSADPAMGTKWERSLDIAPGTLPFAATLQGLTGTDWTASITEGTDELLDPSNQKGSTVSNYSVINQQITIK